MSANVVYHLTPRWSEQLLGGPKGHVAAVRREGERWVCTLAVEVDKPNRAFFSFPVAHGAPRVAPGGAMIAWGLAKLGPGVWNVTPSYHAVGMLHAFVTLVDVPEPAPWEQA